MEADPKRPWWNKRRFRLAVALWLALPLLYVLSAGPLEYCVGRDWLAWRPIYRPVDHVESILLPASRPFAHYRTRSYVKGFRDAGKPWPPPPQPPGRPVFDGFEIKGELPPIATDLDPTPAPVDAAFVPPLPPP